MKHNNRSKRTKYRAILPVGMNAPEVEFAFNQYGLDDMCCEIEQVCKNRSVLTSDCDACFMEIRVCLKTAFDIDLHVEIVGKN